MDAARRPPAHVVEQATRDLRLRRLRHEDAERADIRGWHTAAEGYALMNEQPYDDAGAREVMHTWADAWERDGYGYWVAERLADGVPVGIGGVRRTPGPGKDSLNLYYRLSPDARGHGYARQIGSAATSFALEWVPDLMVTCRINPRNEPSLHTARSVGMTDIGPWRAEHDPADEPDSRLLRAPDTVVGPVEPGSAAYDEVLDLWVRVNEAGGAVGFEKDAPRSDVAAALDAHLADCRSGRAELVRIAAPTLASWSEPDAYGPLLGFGFVTLPDDPKLAHRTTLLRVMVDPDLQGRNLGRLLIATLHARARSHGRAIAEIAYRGGTGLGDFYAGVGYVETGRLPGGLQFSFGTRDDVSMARRLDGRPLGGGARPT
ncbi:GNAT family N-acetyltransferase [Luteipulveratus sp. YIM 133132]|uniref:GNAT family N-acetyltransferase n=1 Tax=Luteipulveratus flavus TaxID=3031728 RepID=UPI0023B1D780|nr:GNAT family N-acetyltransferase [Luteipulveratus sp. YIM 133132]MDE9366577.1 GNAT family N-acetyltransferase [Luteipulveratus sp. YIM 133132]